MHLFSPFSSCFFWYFLRGNSLCQCITLEALLTFMLDSLLAITATGTTTDLILLNIKHYMFVNCLCFCVLAVLLLVSMAAIYIDLFDSALELRFVLYSKTVNVSTGVSGYTISTRIYTFLWCVSILQQIVFISIFSTCYLSQYHLHNWIFLVINPWLHMLFDSSH